MGWPWSGKCPAVTGIDQAKLFYQHCVCMKKRREKTPQNLNNQKAPKHPEGVTSGSWPSEDMLGGYIQLLNQTV